MNKKALISVWDKTDVELIGKFLHKKGYDIISTGGTEKKLKQIDIPVISVESIINSKEIMDGRVKTLHPIIFGGILADKENNTHIKDLQLIGGFTIDVVIVNLYPFKEKAVEAELQASKAIEFIDIGGPSMLRAAAKNFNSVVVLSNSNQYQEFINEYNQNNKISLIKRKEFALEVFRITSEYDQLIFSYLSKQNKVIPDNISFNLSLIEELRYGENPHQKSGFYINKDKQALLWNKYQGKKLSYNNYSDIETSFNIVNEFSNNACCIIKHANPCGFGMGSTTLLSYKKAVASDPVSYFGGIVGFNKEINKEVALELNKSFLECVIAPKITNEALSIFKSKKNLRVLTLNKDKQKDLFSLKSVGGGYLFQEKDFLDEHLSKLNIVTNNKPTNKDLKLFSIGLRLVKYVKSNAIILINNNQLIGLGAGQTSRIDSVKIAIQKAKENNFKLEGAILASDAFFPFSDGLEFASDSGVKTVIQPGGSINDAEVINFANKKNMVMCFTGVRHFYH